MPNTRGYNLRPRRGAKKESQADTTRRNSSIQRKQRTTLQPHTPRSNEDQVARVPEAEEVSNSIARRGQEELTVEDPSLLKY
ncbi:hypothetical protein TNCV_918451 [Trichonephila clavipes]|nr:hypothetical protein TNCV_918451 [Trichonephila clavipes]